MTKTPANDTRALVLNRFVRAETNIERLPYFAPSKRAQKNRTRHELEDEIKHDGVKVVMRWTVEAPGSLGFPCEFDRTVYLALMKTLDERGIPDDGILRFNSLSQLLQQIYPEGKSASRAGKIPARPKNYRGWYYKRLEESIVRMKATTVCSAGAFYSKTADGWIGDTFSLIERYVKKGQKAPTGEVAEQHLIYLGSWLLENLRENYRKPVDLHYHIKLRRPIARALYAFLDGKFYALARKGMSPIVYSIRYKKLCAYLILTPRKYRSLALESLGPSLDELTETGFLSEWELKDSEDGGWKLVCSPGEKFWKDYKENNQQLLLFPRKEKLEYQKGNAALPFPSKQTRCTSNGQAEDELVRLFYERLHGLSEAASVKAEVTAANQAFAKELIAKYGLDAAQYMVEEGVTLIKERKYEVHSFGYLKSMLAELEVSWRRRETLNKEEEKSKQKYVLEREEVRLRRIYQGVCKERLQAFLDGLPANERNEMEEEARRAIREMQPLASDEAIEESVIIELEHILDWEEQCPTFEEWLEGEMGSTVPDNLGNAILERQETLF